MRKPAIKQAENRPPTGGWSVIYHEKGQKFDVAGRSPSKIVETIIEIQKINHTFKSVDAVWDYCNDIWRSRDPKRAIHEGEAPHTPTLPKAMSRDHWKITPSNFGGWLWRWLHFFGTDFQKDEWDMTIARMVRILDPKRSPYTGCPECSNEFATLMEFDSPDKVTNEREAAEWSFRIHNKVNRRVGYPQVSWNSCARTYGWKVEL